MMDVQDVIQIHHILIDIFGGSHGVRDLGALPSCASRYIRIYMFVGPSHTKVDVENKYRDRRHSVLILNVSAGSATTYAR
jgi:hypothetical protein